MFVIINSTNSTLQSSLIGLMLR